MSNKYAFYLLLTVIVVVVIVVVVLKHLFKLLPFHRYENLLITFKDTNIDISMYTFIEICLFFLKAYFFLCSLTYRPVIFFLCTFLLSVRQFYINPMFLLFKINVFLFCLLLRYVFVLMKTTNFIFLFIYL